MRRGWDRARSTVGFVDFDRRRGVSQASRTGFSVNQITTPGRADDQLECQVQTVRGWGRSPAVLGPVPVPFDLANRTWQSSCDDRAVP